MNLELDFSLRPSYYAEKVECAMSKTAEKIFSEALSLSPNDRANLIEKLLSSFECPPDQSIDKLWAAEAEDRIDAYERGEIPAKPAKEVFDKILGKSSR